MANGQLKITWATTETDQLNHTHDILVLLLVNETSHDFTVNRKHIQRKDGELKEVIPPQKEGDVVRGFICFYLPQG